MNIKIFLNSLISDMKRDTENSHILASYIKTLEVLTNSLPDDNNPKKIQERIKTDLDDKLVKAGDVLKAQESSGSSIAEVVGGSSDGDMFPVVGMPYDAFTLIGREVYQMRSDGKLYYRHDKTEELKNNKV